MSKRKSSSGRINNLMEEIKINFETSKVKENFDESQVLDFINYYKTDIIGLLGPNLISQSGKKIHYFVDYDNSNKYLAIKENNKEGKQRKFTIYANSDDCHALKELSQMISYIKQPKVTKDHFVFSIVGKQNRERLVSYSAQNWHIKPIDCRGNSKSKELFVMQHYKSYMDNNTESNHGVGLFEIYNFEIELEYPNMFYASSASIRNANKNPCRDEYGNLLASFFSTVFARPVTYIKYSKRRIESETLSVPYVTDLTNEYRDNLCIESLTDFSVPEAIVSFLDNPNRFDQVSAIKKASIHRFSECLRSYYLNSVADDRNNLTNSLSNFIGSIEGIFMEGAEKVNCERCNTDIFKKNNRGIGFNVEDGLQKIINKYNYKNHLDPDGLYKTRSKYFHESALLGSDISLNIFDEIENCNFKKDYIPLFALVCLHYTLSGDDKILTKQHVKSS